MKKIAVITAARSEYGLLKWIMKALEASDKFELQLIVTGAHLMNSQGHTVDYITEDGFKIDYTIECSIEPETKQDIVNTMSEMMEGAAKAYEELKPDYIVVLGDRYELLSFCNAALIMQIPIIHISGGDITEGAIDNSIRNSITMLADYHFPGTKDSADNIVRMLGRSNKIWCIGEPGLDAFYKEKLMSREELADNLNLDGSKKWILMTYHTETRIAPEANMAAVKACIENLLRLENTQAVITYANADLGGKQINEYLEETSEKYHESIRVIPSLGQKRYLSFMKQAFMVIGNSSSGIVEAPMFDIPVVNIGDRQKGRHICENIFCTDADEKSIETAIINAGNYNKGQNADMNFWGDGHTAERFIQILEKELG